MLIGVDDAFEIVLNQNLVFGTEDVDINDSIGRVLKKDVTASRPYPPFDRVTMDGICIDYKTYQAGTRLFKVERIQGAGQTPKPLEDKSNCIEIMTGAMLPEGTDTVIRYEDLSPEPNNCFRIVSNVQNGQNIHGQGEDKKYGTVLIPANTRIGPAEIGVLATEGVSRVCVSKIPKVAIISTGDELVAIDDDPTDHQIRRSNVYMIHADLISRKVRSSMFHYADQYDEIESKIKNVLDTNDVLILSGGVSKGKFDFIPPVLAKLGFEKLFHGVAQRPGKPFWFGRKDDKLVFALPGNPVSTLVSYIRYFLPWLSINQDDKQKPVYYKLKDDVTFVPDLNYFAPVKLINNNGAWEAEVFKTNGSGDFSSLVHMDGFIELPRGKSKFLKGHYFRFWSL